MRVTRAALAAGFACAIFGCGAASSRVMRVVDGRLVEGRFVEPEAYALFLRAAIAESSGSLDEAIRAYEGVARLDDGDPEVYARIARARCARDPRDPLAHAALDRAFALDANYGTAWAAAAACGGGDVPRVRAANAAPRDVPLQVSLARALEQSSSASATDTRARLLALTLEHPSSSEALSALSSWADAHDDLDLLVLALSEASRRAPRLDAATARGALALGTEGHLARARRIACVLLDARARRAGAPVDETTLAAVGRLAVDEAAEHGDQPSLERRAVTAHLTNAEAAARAAMRGRYDLARNLALTTLGADPNDVGARMVLASSSSRDVHIVFDSPPQSSARAIPAIACALFAQALYRTSGAAAAHAMLQTANCAPIAHDDVPALALVVDLAARGLIDETDLPIEGRIELAWRTRVPLPAPALWDLDMRHELLARAQAEPLSARTAELAAKLARRGPTDAIVLASLLAVARARGETLDQVARAALKPPANAVLDAALIDALPVSAPESVRVRARFAGLAATPAERALVR